LLKSNPISIVVSRNGNVYKGWSIVNYAAIFSLQEPGCSDLTRDRGELCAGGFQGRIREKQRFEDQAARLGRGKVLIGGVEFDT
jgi:hypothetical protein